MWGLAAHVTLLVESEWPLSGQPVKKKNIEHVCLHRRPQTSHKKWMAVKEWIRSGWPLSGHPLSTRSIPCAASLKGGISGRILRVCQEEAIFSSLPYKFSLATSISSHLWVLLIENKEEKKKKRGALYTQKLILKCYF